MIYLHIIRIIQISHIIHIMPMSRVQRRGGAVIKGTESNFPSLLGVYLFLGRVPLLSTKAAAKARLGRVHEIPRHTRNGRSPQPTAARLQASRGLGIRKGSSRQASTSSDPCIEPYSCMPCGKILCDVSAIGAYGLAPYCEAAVTDSSLGGVHNVHHGVLCAKLTEDVEQQDTQR